MFEATQDNCRTATRRRWGNWAAILLTGGVTAATTAGTLHVDASAPAGGDGATWNTAHRFLQDALAAAGPNSGISEIRVAQGVYKPDRSAAFPNGTGDRHASFQLRHNVPLRGGYAGLSGTDPDERDIAAFETILSGDLLGNDGPAFEGNEENSYTVVLAEGVGMFTIEGITVSGGNANLTASEDISTYLGGGVYGRYGELQILYCTIRSNHARHGGGIYTRFVDLHVEESSLLDNRAVLSGGGLLAHDSPAMLMSSTVQGNEGESGGGINLFGNSDATIELCTFVSNTAEIGAGIYMSSLTCITLSHTSFVGNHAYVASGGALLMVCPNRVLENCVFHNNHAGMLGSAVSFGNTSQQHLDFEVRNCAFTSNTGASFGGTIIDEIGASFNNCLVANNTANGAMVFYKGASPPHFTNCTVANNSGYGFSVDPGTEAFSAPPLRITNSIVWGNTLGNFHPSVPNLEVNYSNIQGGWPGIGNIDAEPMFVQPANVDYRLVYGSPCIDVGDNASVPSHITIDLAGNPRIQNGIVDMGAYEGEFDSEAPTAYADGINEGELRVLVPMGLPHQPIFKPAAVIWNISGGDGAWAKATQYATDQHHGAGGYKTLGPTLEFETSIEDGDLYARVFISFDESELNGIDPVDMDLTYYDPGTNNWDLAVSNNTVNSPGHDTPVGERHVQINGSFVVSPNLGDYGIYWRQDLERVLVWAVVDHADASFRPGHIGCVGDLAEPQGHVSTSDLLELLSRWGEFGGPADLNWDGVVDVSDLLILLRNWGPCP